jgi:oxygen-independent coproporphyrinogen-3 oxidase
MGYTTQKTHMLLGLGVSSISDAGAAFAQNHKTLHDYYASVSRGELAVTKGYFLNDEDLAFRRYILDVSCKGAVQFDPKDLPLLERYTFPELQKLEEDKLVTWNTHELRVTDTGRQFIRNICKAFDLHLLRSETSAGKKLFSKAI